MDVDCAGLQALHGDLGRGRDALNSIIIVPFVGLPFLVRIIATMVKDDIQRHSQSIYETTATGYDPI